MKSIQPTIPDDRELLLTIFGGQSVQQRRQATTTTACMQCEQSSTAQTKPSKRSYYMLAKQLTAVVEQNSYSRVVGLHEIRHRFSTERKNTMKICEDGSEICIWMQFLSSRFHRERVAM